MSLYVVVIVFIVADISIAVNERMILVEPDYLCIRTVRRVFVCV